MHQYTFNFANFHHFGPTFYDYLRLRKVFFVDKLNWDIPHDNDVEMDQYDTPLAYYSVVVENGRVIGGARTMPTSSKWGEATYMLKDATDGKLGSIPQDVLPEVDIDNSVWECTRLVISDELTCPKRRSECLALIVRGLVDVSADQGAEELMSLSPITLIRAFRQLGYTARQFGKSYMSFEDGRKYAVLKMRALNPLELAETA